MRYARWAALLLGAAALFWAWQSDSVSTLQGYLPAWLFFASVPLGALPLLLGMEAIGIADIALATALRRLLPAMPLAALLGVPLLLHVTRLYDGGGLTGFAAHWFRPGPLAMRQTAFLVVWTLLALALMRRPYAGPWRRGLAVAGLLLHVGMGTLAAVDWTLSLQPAPNASSFGLLAMVGQCGVALSAATLLAARLGDTAAVVAAARPMLALLGAWAFLQFTQYLIVWSANLPGEIDWYRQRQSGLGLAAVLFAFGCCVLALFALLPRRVAQRTIAGVAALLLALHLVEALWLTLPAWRGGFVPAGSDLLPVLGIGGMLAFWLSALQRQRVPHA